MVYTFVISRHFNPIQNSAVRVMLSRVSGQCSSAIVPTYIESPTCVYFVRPIYNLVRYSPGGSSLHCANIPLPVSK